MKQGISEFSSNRPHGPSGKSTACVCSSKPFLVVAEKLSKSWYKAVVDMASNATLQYQEASFKYTLLRLLGVHKTVQKCITRPRIQRHVQPHLRMREVPNI